MPFRGGYLRLRDERSDLIRASVYPVPDPDLPFLGAHLTRGPDGNVLLGPSALLVRARDAYEIARLRAADLQRRRLARDLATDARFWRTGLVELSHAASKRAFVREAQRFVPELRPGDFVAGPSGIRGQAVARDGSLVDDFVYSRTERALYVRNAPRRPRRPRSPWGA